MRAVVVIAFYCGTLWTGHESMAQQFKVLHYSEAGGFDHQTRAVSFAMFQNMGNNLGFTVDHDSTGLLFSTATTLANYNVVVFSNTTGDNILDAAQRSNFGQYMNAGGAFIGIHSASDTCRHSSAGGTDTGTWDWYAEMQGASEPVTFIPLHGLKRGLYHVSVFNDKTSVTLRLLRS